MQKCKGSFTIEAVIIIPMILFMLVTALEQGIDLYKKSAEHEVAEVVKNWDAVSLFYDTWVVKKMGEVLGNE